MFDLKSMLIRFCMLITAVFCFAETAVGKTATDEVDELKPCRFEDEASCEAQRAFLYSQCLKRGGEWPSHDDYGEENTNCEQLVSNYCVHDYCSIDWGSGEYRPADADWSQASSFH